MSTNSDEHSKRAATGPANLNTLPFYILQLIVWDDRLNATNVSAFRLICRSPRHRRRFSPCFLAICNSPHLAEHVHEVEWLEISWDITLFSRFAHVLSPDDSLLEVEGAEDIFRYLDTEAAAVFWMSNLPPRPTDLQVQSNDEVNASRQKDVIEFRGSFDSAIDMLPNLHSFILHPMTPDRIINPGSNYPMAAYQFYYLRTPLPASAFEGLEVLELWLIPVHAPESSFERLQAACLSAVPTLRYLKLGALEGKMRTSCLALSGCLLDLHLPLLPGCALKLLTLIGGDYKTTMLIKIIKANVATLRYLRLNQVTTKNSLIWKLKDLPHLNLKTMEILDPDARSRTSLCERVLLCYVNGEDPKSISHCEDWEFSCWPDVVKMGGEKKHTRHFVTAKHVEPEEHEEPQSPEIDSQSDVSEDTLEYRLLA
ncbi:hypothetical protein N0V88_007375 [Collariella sp. IMI 366227]|nr:hypothetical protein N0V88_007375 [Collariella sp. IMI 366227]